MRWTIGSAVRWGGLFVRCAEGAALLFMLLSACAGLEIEVRGRAPATREFALAAGQGNFAHAVGTGLAAEGIEVVPLESAEYLLRVSYDLEFTRPAFEPRSEPRLIGWNIENHQTGGTGLAFGGRETDASGLEVERTLDTPDPEWAAVLTLTVIRRATGKTVWTGWARDWAKASRTETATPDWIERAVRKLVREMRSPTG